MTKRGLGWMALSLAVVIMPVMFWNNWKTMKSRKSAAEIKSSILRMFQNFPKSLSRKTGEAKNSTVSGAIASRNVPTQLPTLPVNPSQKIHVQGPAVSRPVSAVVPAAGVPKTPLGQLPPQTSLGDGRPRTESPRASAVPGVAPILSTTSAVKPQEPVWYNAKTDRDPTLSPAEQRRMERTRYLESHPAAPASTRPIRATRQAAHPVSIERRIKLTAIVMTPGNTRAIVNDQIMKVGDNVFGARIVRITNTRVFFRYKNKQFTKVMPQE